MAELTIDQLEKARTMPLEELRALAIAEAAGSGNPAPEAEDAEAEKPKAAKQARDTSGKFTNAEVLDNSADETEDPAEEEEPVQVFRKTITNDDGSTDTYEGETVEELIDAIAEGKRQAVNQLKKVQAEKRTLESKTEQQTKDEEYVTSQTLKDHPRQTIREVAAELLREERETTARSIAIQSKFVNTHPLYVADPKSGNGDRLVSEFQRLYPTATEFTSEGLEKAYDSLNTSGLLVLRQEEAERATEDEAEVTERIAQPKAEATQRVSPRKSSTISTRTSSKGVRTNQEPTEDEAYSMPIEKLRALADRQLRGSE